MKNSFSKIFGVTTTITLILMIICEWFLNKEIQPSHVIGWLFVAAFIGALVGIIQQKSNH